ncbi:hypothetical protein QYF36_019286 [Acer negundo]|nr:hypothetical protein QYF36_019286 [Acer negundo]
MDNRHVGGERNFNGKCNLRFGMLFIYTPSFLAGLASFWLFPHHNFRFLLLVSALTIHFFKRIFEVIFIHKYSGSIMVDSGILISLSYLISTSIMIYSQYLSQELGEPSIDLKYLGIFLFLVGISGRSYATRKWYLSKFEDFPKHVKAIYPYLF